MSKLTKTNVFFFICKWGVKVRSSTSFAFVMLITVRIPRQKSDFWLTVTLQIVGWRVFPSCFIGSSLNQTTLINQHPSGCWSVPMARWNALGSMVFPWTMPSSWCCSPLRETGTIQPGRIGILMPSSNGIWAANIGMTPKHSDDIWYINKMVMLTNANSNIWRVWQTMKYIYIYIFFFSSKGFIIWDEHGVLIPGKKLGYYEVL